VEITNTMTGQHVPTDHPGRHLILIVELLDEGGQPLTQLSGSSVPVWGGEQAGEPGKTFAKVLRDVESGEYPVVSYWKQTSLVSDNRIPAGESDKSTFAFAAPEGKKWSHYPLSCASAACSRNPCRKRIGINPT
jgi:hypothetical protein